MDTMLILHIALLSIAAIVSSQSINKTIRLPPVTFTVSKVIDLTKPSNNVSLRPELNRKSKSSKNPIGISKRQDPSFTDSLSNFDEPSGAIYSDSFSGFPGNSKDSFDIDDIDVKSPPFDIEDSRIKSGPSFNHKIKEPSPFDDSPSFNSDGGSFNNDETNFNIDTDSFDDEDSQKDKEEQEQEEQEEPAFNIDSSDFDINDSPTKKPDSFESGFSSAKRSPPYNSGKAQRYRETPEVYNSKASRSREQSYEPSSKGSYKHSKNQGQSYSDPQSSYSERNSGPVYSDSNVQYVGSSATPISFITTPYYEKFNSLTADGSKALSAPDEAFQGFGQSPFENSIFDQGSFGKFPFQNLNSNAYLQTPQSSATQTPIYTTQYPGPKNSQRVFPPTQETAIVAVEADPLLLDTERNFNFRAPNFGIPFNFGSESINHQFLAGGDRGHIVPLQTAGGNSQFPQYKGASVQARSRSDYDTPGGYQFLTNQPQLHFNRNQAPVERVHNFNTPNAFERIRTDVEVINKKKPKPPPKHDDDDDEQETEEESDQDEELEDGYNDDNKEYSQSDEDENSRAELNSEEAFSEVYSSEEPEFKSMQQIGSFGFQPYNEKMGNFRDFEDQSQPQSRFSVESSAEDEEYSAKQYSSVEDDGSDDDEDSKKSEKQVQTPNAFSGQGLSALRNYDLQFKKKFNQPYKSAASKTKFAQDRTGIPDISKYKKKKNSQETAESVKKISKAGIDSPLKRISKNNEDDGKLDFGMDDFDKSFGYKIPSNLDENQKFSINKRTASSSRFKKDNSHQQKSSKKRDKTVSNKQTPKVTDSLVRPSQEVKNIAFVTEDDYSFFSPQRIKSGLNGNLF